MMRSFFCTVLVVVCSCAKPTPAPDSGSAHATSDRLHAPITVTWEPSELSASKVRVMAHIKRLAPMGAVSVRIEVPRIARMTIGRTTFEVPANAAADEIVEPVELTYPQLPVQDLVLHVTSASAGSGLSYAVPYRFGRMPPIEPGAKADGPSVIINGRDMGPTIPLDKKQE